MNNHRSDCRCADCLISRSFKGSAEIPQVSGGSRLIWGSGFKSRRFGQDDGSDNGSSDDSAPVDLTDPSLDTSAPAQTVDLSTMDNPPDPDQTASAAPAATPSDDSSDDSSDSSGLSIATLTSLVASGAATASQVSQLAKATGLVPGSPAAKSLTAKAAAAKAAAVPFSLSSGSTPLYLGAAAVLAAFFFMRKA